jgi:GNAT superfamily N-acetyltransferase
MHLRKLEPHEASVLREFRLRSLQDAPDAFRDVHSDIATRPQSYWDDFIASLTGGENVMLVACEGNLAVGFVFGLGDRSHARPAGAGGVGGMWVDPKWRRRGVGEALLRGVVDWAHNRSFERLTLWCVVGAVGPNALYRKQGFRETGNEEPLSPASALRIAQMELPL